MTPALERHNVTVYCGDVRAVLAALPEASVQCVVTSPPYWGLRDYGVAGAIGLEHTMDCLGWATGQACGACYLCHLLAVFDGVKRVLRMDGVCWVNMGDSFAGSWGAQSRPNGTDSGSTLEGGSTLHARQIQAHPHGTHTGSLKHTPGIRAKSLCLVPQRFALAMQAQGWIVRQVLPWVKRSCLPESCQDRPTTALEWWYMLTQRPQYYCDMAVVRQQNSLEMQTRAMRGDTRGPGGKLDTFRHDTNTLRGPAAQAITANGRNFRNTDVWFQSLHPPHGLVGMGDELVGLDVVSQGFAGAHFAVFPPKLIVPLIQMGSREGDTVLDPFVGSGTVLDVARGLGRRSIGIELSPAYLALIRDRLQEDLLPFA